MRRLHPPLPPPSAEIFFLLQSRVSTVIPVVPLLSGDGDRGKTMPLPVLAVQWQTRCLCAMMRPLFLRERSNLVVDGTELFIQSQSTRAHFSTAVSLCNQYLLLNDKVKAESLSITT